MRYAQNQESKGIFNHVTTVLLPSGRVGVRAGELFGVNEAPPLPLKGAKTLKIARPPHNSDWKAKWYHRPK